MRAQMNKAPVRGQLKVSPIQREGNLIFTEKYTCTVASVIGCGAVDLGAFRSKC